MHELQYKPVGQDMLCSAHAQSRQRLEAFYLPDPSGQGYGKGTGRRGLERLAINSKLTMYTSTLSELCPGGLVQWEVRRSSCRRLLDYTCVQTSKAVSHLWQAKDIMTGA